MSKYTILFKNYMFPWWQVGILKISLLLVGIAAGAKWPEFFKDYILTIFIVGLAGALYMKHQGFKQQ